LNYKNPESQLARWFEVLALYDVMIEHRAGKSRFGSKRFSVCLKADF
jgi:hypothetical protein